jgi:DNA-binding response OmpR family regulator
MTTTLLIVDDDALLGWTLAANLEDAGFEVEVFDNGRSALSYLATGQKAECVLLDWHMRGMDGPSFLTEVRNHGHNLPVLVLTGSQQPDVKARAIAQGAAGCLDKARSFNTILEHVKLTLSRTQARAAQHGDGHASATTH